MKRVLALIIASTAFVGWLETPAYSAQSPALEPNRVCTTSQTAMMHLGERAMHYAVDISQHVGGPKADRAVLAIMDLIESIDRSLPASCRLGG